MEYDSPQFTAAVKKVLQDSLAHLANSLEDLKDAVSAHWQADEKRYETKPVTVADLRTDIPIRVQTEAEYSKAEAIWRYIKGALEAVGIGAVIFYTYFAYHQWQEMITANKQAQYAVDAANRSAAVAEKSLKESRENFQKSNRPYLWLNLGLMPPPGEPSIAAIKGSILDWNDADRTVIWSFHFKNFGKSTALHVVLDKNLAIGPNAWRKVHWHETNENSNVLPPDGDGWETAHSREQMSLHDYLKLRSQWGQIAVFGHIEYEDLDGHHYWSEFCFFQGHVDNIESCPTHNIAN